MLSDKENGIIELIYDAAIDPKLWGKVLEEIVAFTQSTTAIYTYLDQLNPEQNFVITHNIPEVGLENYHKEHLDLIDMKLHGEKMKALGVGRSYILDSLPYESMPYTDQQKFYEKCLKPSNIRYVNGVLLDHGAYKWAMFAIHRSHDSKGYSEHDKKILERFAKHLRMSLQIYKQVVELKSENRKNIQILEKLKVGVILLNEKMELRFSNQSAQNILNQTNLIWVDQKQCIKTLANYQNQLDQLILSVLNQSAEASMNYEKGGVLCIKNTAESSLMLTVVPLNNIPHDELIKINKAVAIFITPSNAKYSLSKKVMKEVYNLSPREIEICELFLNGYDLEGITQHCKITMSSLRTYLKTIFSKTKCNSQVELIRLLMGLTFNFEHIE
ncbi:helix-turn-helix transcriptional regulator [Acinetobacter sp. LoGeW2-3]|uniref:helix-turn-helix transcriptional regulator n=1 Tax=Acinetobacter sp. LoGeW2-3 TaxID=1808001 RepID=UPI000C058ED9|nr:LuxR C-terminal-related transcriptional regulator [Acinetobacter sp. LoGeW2-3]ATO18283.1 helix-turn-helix transcriptional regulator [Acinetobacter sp. LoGeW2-3]